MKYQPGDEIIVLLSNEEGKVVEIINDQLVMIDVRGVKQVWRLVACVRPLKRAKPSADAFVKIAPSFKA